MQNCEYFNNSILNNEINTEWEAAYQNTPGTLLLKLIHFWSLSGTLDGSVDFQDELHAQTGPLFLVPLRRLDDVPNCGGLNMKLMQELRIAEFR